MPFMISLSAFCRTRFGACLRRCWRGHMAPAAMTALPHAQATHALPTHAQATHTLPTHALPTLALALVLALPPALTLSLVLPTETLAAESAQQSTSGVTAAASPSTSAFVPVSVRDDTGHEVRLDAPAKRIIALYGAFNELLLALGAGDCWAIYILTGQRAGAEHGPATVAVGSLIAALIFVPIGALQAGDALWHWSILPLGLAIAVLSTALPYSLEMIALTRLPTRTFGTLMSMEPALAAVSGMIFLGETLTLIQTLALGAIIVASMGSTLTIRKEPQIKQVDVN